MTSHSEIIGKLNQRKLGQFTIWEIQAVFSVLHDMVVLDFDDGQGSHIGSRLLITFHLE